MIDKSIIAGVIGEEEVSQFKLLLDKSEIQHDPLHNQFAEVNEYNKIQKLNNNSLFV